MEAEERQQLGLEGGQRLLDVGCGLGDAAVVLADDLAPHGEIVGVDAPREMVTAAPPGWRRLPDLVRASGLELVAENSATQIWNAWNPDESPAPDGCFSMHSLACDLVDAGQLAAGDRERFVSTIHQAARNNRFSLTLTMFAVVAAAPTTAP